MYVDAHIEDNTHAHTYVIPVEHVKLAIYKLKLGKFQAWYTWFVFIIFLYAKP